MAVTITNIYNDIASDRSRRVSVTAGSSLADVIAGIETVLMTAPGGWSIHDAAAGANAKCYKSLQKDGTSYTYMALDWSTVISTGMAGLIVRLYEDWNAATHTGINKAENSRDRNYSAIAEHLMGQTLPFGDSDPWQIDVHVLPGGAAFFSSREVAQVTTSAAFLGSPTYGGVTVVGECLRENPNTLPPGVPAAIWTNGGRMSGLYPTWGYQSMCRSFNGGSNQYTATFYPGISAIDSIVNAGYSSPKTSRPSGTGGVQFVSTIVPAFSPSPLSDYTYDFGEMGAIRGVLCVGRGNPNNSVWEVACDADYLPAAGGTNRKFRCYVGSGGPMCLLLPI